MARRSWGASIATWTTWSRLSRRWSSPDRGDYYANPRRGAVPEWKNEMAEMSWLFWLTFDGVRSAGEVSVPTIMVHSDGCAFPDHAKAVHAALRGPKRLEWFEGTQIDFYDQEPYVTNAVAIAAPHFRATLAADSRRFTQV